MILRYRRYWLALGWLFVGMVIVLSLIPNPPDPMAFKQHDKLNHFLGYGWLMFWFGQLYLRWTERLVCAIGFVVLGVTMEFAQGLTAYRQFEVWDMAANAAGVVIGVLLILTPLRSMLAYLESRWMKA